MRIAQGIQVDDAALAAVREQYAIAELEVFGSPAQGYGSSRQRYRRSLLPAPRLQARLGFEQLADELAGLFGLNVDLVSLRALRLRLKSGVLAEARPLYAA